MGSCCTAEAPTPPSPQSTAAAATSTNVGTAVANAYLNNTNQNTPSGSLTYNQSGSQNWHDPYTGQDISIPQFTATQTLSPQEQAIASQGQTARYNMAGLAADQSGRISDLLQNNVDLSAAPSGGKASTITGIDKAKTSFDAGGPIQSSIGGYGQQQTTFGDAGAITRSYEGGGDITRDYGPADNYSADRQRVEGALLDRMNPQLQRERQSVTQSLADQGIRYGSPAYTAAMDNYNRQANDARYGAIAQGGVEQQRLDSMAAQRAGFQNSAQQQAYGQNAQTAAFQNAAQGQAYGQEQGRGQFANAAQAQNYEQALGAGTFANAAQGQQFGQNAQQAAFNNAGLAQQVAQAQSGFNASQAERNAYLNEQYAGRNQAINETSALMSGGQVNAPNFINTPGSQIATTDVGGLINQNYAQQFGNYQQANQNNQQLLGGALGLGAGALRLSDRREKEDVERMGTIFATDVEQRDRDDREKMGNVITPEPKELPIYRYTYKMDPSGTKHIGPMAQDVEKLDKKAVKNIGGRKYLDTRRMMGGILRAA